MQWLDFYCQDAESQNRMSTSTTSSTRRAAPLLFLVLFAVVCGFVGVAFRIFNSTELVEKPAAPPLVQIPVAVADLESGRKIQASDFFLLPLSNEEFSKLAAGKYVFNSGRNLIGRIVRNTVKAGTPFFLDSVYLEGTGPTPAELLTEGMRAITVNVTLVGGVRGFVSPNSWVDVLFRREQGEPPESTEIARTHTLLSEVRVIALQDNTYSNTVLFADKSGRSPDAFELTLEVTPEQAEVLKSLEGRGDLSLNMLPNDPNRKNRGNLPAPEVMKIVLGVEEPQPVPTPTTPVTPPSVRIVRGGTQSQVAVDYQTDLIMNDSLYPAPPQNTVRPPDTPGPPLPAPPSSSQWPQRRLLPVDSSDSDRATPSSNENPTPTDAPSATGPASLQPPRRSQNDDSSVIVQQRLNLPSRIQPSNPISPRSSFPPILTPLRGSRAAKYQTSGSSDYPSRQSPSPVRPSVSSQRQPYMAGLTPIRRASGNIGQFRATYSSFSNGPRPSSLPLMVSGAQAPTPIRPHNNSVAASARYASDPRRAVVLSPSSATIVRRTGLTTSVNRSVTTARSVAPNMISSTFANQSGRLPILKSGRHD